MHFITCNFLRMLILSRVSRVLTTAALFAVATGLLAPVFALPALGGLHALLLGYVLVVGAVVAHYSATNLRGQRHQQRYAALLLLTVAALAVMVASGDLVVSAVGASVSGWALTGLVAHRGDESARRAARVVGWHLGGGDLALWGAVLTHLLGGPDAVVAVGIAVACVARSALVPAQRWLPETSEAPSPVSALLHGGVVNGGLMLVLVHWSVVSGQPVALAVLGACGVISVALGLLQGRLRPDVKGRLASSTNAQMGLGALALSLGLPEVALLHLLGHGLWKGWLFLRAGGAIARASSPSPRPGARSGVAPTAAALAAGASVLGAGLLLGRSHDLPGGLALPSVVAAALAGTAALEAARLERVRRGLRALMVAGGPTAVLAYLGGVVVLERGTHTWFEGTVTAAPTTWGLMAGALVVALGLAAVRLRPSSTSAVAALVSPGLLPPGARPARDVRALGASEASGELTPHRPSAIAEVAASSVPTSWPLTSLVAVNPLADLERFPVEDAAAMVARQHGRDPRPTLGLFLDLQGRGVIPRSALRTALQEVPNRLRGQDLDTFLAVSRGGATTSPGAPLRVRACDLAPAGRGGFPASHALELQTASWTARAWSEPSGLDPWTLWRTQASRHLHDVAWRQRGVSAWARTLPEDAESAVRVLWQQVRPRLAGVDLVSYAASLLTAAPGWTGHAKWRVAHGGEPGALVSLLALRMALDLVLSSGSRRRPAATLAPAVVEPPTAERILARETVAVWQRALDLSARNGLVTALARSDARAGAGGDHVTASRVQSVWCIDVRSERVRRAAERSPDHETFGYAGFFGAAVRHVDADGHSEALCPGLIAPALDLHDHAQPLRPGEALHRWVTRVGRQPAATFGYAELNGAPALAATLATSVSGARWRRTSQQVTGSAPTAVAPGPGLPHEVAVEAAAALLTVTGIAARPGEVVVLVGHASSTENNAFAAAYDCGACGGHRGALNAVLVAESLEDPDVRTALAARGLMLPATTTFVAAQHDTTTDRVVLVRRDTGPVDPRAAEAVAELDRAAARAADERRHLLPGQRRDLHQRAADWSEPMPEWGLAGNLALVVGPRTLTAGLDLGGTAFLHSYEPDLDPDGSVLAAVMAGPVVVTQWINAQYFASSSAPGLLGSGDKTTHNAVGGIGVLTGAHGDLRTGLPWQAVADRDPEADAADSSVLRHLPARHLVVVAAPRSRVQEMLRGHRGLRDAVAHGWVQLIVVEESPSGEGRTLGELGRDLDWHDVVPQQPSRVHAG